MSARGGSTGAQGAQGAQGARGPRGQDTRNPAVWALAFALVLCFTMLTVAVHRNQSAINVATRALCSQKQDIGERLRQTNQFIVKMDGTQFIQVGNVRYSRAELLKSQRDLKAEYDNLRDVVCP